MAEVITDNQVCQAYIDAHASNQSIEETSQMVWPYHLLKERTGLPERQCYSAMCRAYSRGYIDYGVSLRAGWVTQKGKELITGRMVQ